MRTSIFNGTIFLLAISTLVLARCIVSMEPPDRDFLFGARIQNELSGNQNLKVHCKPNYYIHFIDRLIGKGDYYTVLIPVSVFSRWPMGKGELWCKLSWGSTKAKHGGVYKFFWKEEQDKLAGFSSSRAALPPPFPPSPVTNSAPPPSTNLQFQPIPSAPKPAIMLPSPFSASLSSPNPQLRTPTSSVKLLCPKFQHA
ncbi:hypothetical protein M0R45_016721 [Rubus argutus]|uniref:S-protein homolog n=1 Tax=Rubus argutus TaxID=59490 RepID=A0AAW1XUV3_RUBAR